MNFKHRLPDEDVEWMQDAKCRDRGSDIFYPEDGQSHTTQWAKYICNGSRHSPPCPVKRDCLRYALEGGEMYGVWGGLTARERQCLPKPRRILRTVEGTV